jgi:hypothetical protein
MGGKSSAPDPPDYSKIAAASEKSAEYSFQLGKDQLAWAKEQFAQNKEVSDAVIESALGRAGFPTSRRQPTGPGMSRYSSPWKSSWPVTPRIMPRRSARKRPPVAPKRTSPSSSSRREPQPHRSWSSLASILLKPARVRSTSSRGLRKRPPRPGQVIRLVTLLTPSSSPCGPRRSTLAAVIRARLLASMGRRSTRAIRRSTQDWRRLPLALHDGHRPQWQGIGNQGLGIWGNTLNHGLPEPAGLLAGQPVSELLRHRLSSRARGWVSPPASSPASRKAARWVPPSLRSPSRTRASGACRRQSGGAGVDDVPAQLTAGEFVIPKDVMAWKGQEWAQKEIMKARKQSQSPARRRRSRRWDPDRSAADADRHSDGR